MFRNHCGVRDPRPVASIWVGSEDFAVDLDAATRSGVRLRQGSDDGIFAFSDVGQCEGVRAHCCFEHGTADEEPLQAAGGATQVSAFQKPAAITRDISGDGAGFDQGPGNSRKYFFQRRTTTGEQAGYAGLVASPHAASAPMERCRVDHSNFPVAIDRTGGRRSATSLPMIDGIVALAGADFIMACYIPFRAHTTDTRVRTSTSGFSGGLHPLRHRLNCSVVMRPAPTKAGPASSTLHCRRKRSCHSDRAGEY